MDEIEKLETFPYSHQDRMFGRYSGKGYKQLLIGAISFNCITSKSIETQAPERDLL